MRLSIGAVVFSLVAIAGGFALFYLTSLGGEACEVYCGPGGLLLPLALLGGTPLLWLSGAVLSIVAVVRSRAKEPLGWVGVGLTLVLPIALAVAVQGTG